MALYENKIREKGDYILSQIEQIKRLSNDRNLLFFLNEIRDSAVEMTYTSDEWFVEINMLDSKNLALSQKIQGFSEVVNKYEDALDDYDSALSKKRK